MFDWSNQPTSSIIQTLIHHLTQLGYNSLQTHERWEKDGVFLVSSPDFDLASRKWDNGNVSCESGWYLSVAGHETGYEPCGIDFIFIYPTSSDEYDIHETVESWSHLRLLIETYAPATLR